MPRMTDHFVIKFLMSLVVSISFWAVIEVDIFYPVKLTGRSHCSRGALKVKYIRCPTLLVTGQIYRWSRFKSHHRSSQNLTCQTVTHKLPSPTLNNRAMTVIIVSHRQQLFFSKLFKTQVLNELFQSPANLATKYLRLRPLRTSASPNGWHSVLPKSIIVCRHHKNKDKNKNSSQ